MARKIPAYYIACQIGGWSLVPASAYLVNSAFTGRPFVFAGIGLLATHWLRNRIITQGGLTMPLRKGLPRLFISLLLAAALAAFLFGISCDGLTWRTGWQILDYAFLILPWTLMYCLYLYVEKTRREERDSRRLAMLLVEKQQQAAGAAVEIGSILDTLSRIRALIDEDPGRSRSEITAFSNLLRNGYLQRPPDSLPLA